MHFVVNAAADTVGMPCTEYIKVLQVAVSDTVGCGDSFAAAIVMGYTRGHDIDVTLALANAVGAATATGVGAGRNVATADTVRRLLTKAADGFATSHLSSNGLQGSLKSAASKAINILDASLSGSTEASHL